MEMTVEDDETMNDLAMIDSPEMRNVVFWKKPAAAAKMLNDISILIHLHSSAPSDLEIKYLTLWKYDVDKGKDTYTMDELLKEMSNSATEMLDTEGEQDNLSVGSMKIDSHSAEFFL